MITKIFQLSFYVFVCAFRPDISLFFDKSFPFLFLFLCYLFLGTFLSMCSHLRACVRYATAPPIKVLLVAILAGI